MANERKLGWIPDHPDKRDFKYKAPEPIMVALPEEVDLRPKMPPVYNQQSIGSCTANAISSNIMYCDLNDGNKTQVPPSRLFIYYNERLLEGTVTEDAGAMIRDGLKSINKWGYAPEAVWPYITTKFRTKPPKGAYDAAAKHKVLDYYSVAQDEKHIKACLAEGHPVVIGFTVYDSFMSDQVARTGIMPMPDFKKESVVGGHAVLVVGYSNKTKYWIVANSWGRNFGISGYFMMPMQYLTDSDLSSDFWTIRRVPPT